MKYTVDLLLFIVSGCQSLGGAKGVANQELEPFDGTGHVYIYRPSSLVMGLAIPSLEMDGMKVMSVRNGSYTLYKLVPGNHTFVFKRNSNWEIPDIKFVTDIKRNERQFYRLSPAVSELYIVGDVAAQTMNGHVMRVSDEDAISEMETLLYTGSWP
jgi:uncharacterized protein DUF2846